MQRVNAPVEERVGAGRCNNFRESYQTQYPRSTVTATNNMKATNRLKGSGSVQVKFTTLCRRSKQPGSFKHIREQQHGLKTKAAQFPKVKEPQLLWIVLTNASQTLQSQAVRERARHQLASDKAKTQEEGTDHDAEKNRETRNYAHSHGGQSYLTGKRRYAKVQ